MNPRIQRFELPQLPADAATTHPAETEQGFEEPAFDELQWDESRAERDAEAAGGRAVLGGGLAVLALLWTGYTAWSAGRALAIEPLSSPAIAQWVAIAAGPLALL